MSTSGHLTPDDAGGLFWEPAAETLATAELGALQMRRLREMLESAAANIPFYRRKLAEAGVEPGGLAKVLDELAAAQVSIDYLYSISFQNICFAVRDIDRAIELLQDKVTLLTDEEVRAL